MVNQDDIHISCDSIFKKSWIHTKNSSSKLSKCVLWIPLSCTKLLSSSNLFCIPLTYLWFLFCSYQKIYFSSVNLSTDEQFDEINRFHLFQEQIWCFKKCIIFFFIILFIFALKIPLKLISQICCVLFLKNKVLKLNQNQICLQSTCLCIYLNLILYHTIV